jgi:hypothetical protein
MGVGRSFAALWPVGCLLRLEDISVCRLEKSAP